MKTESSEDHRKCSEKKMQPGDDGVKTVESLRGRLLAERQASRIAKEDAERMGNKLMEIEKMLKEEIKLRNKAEKKLKFLKKKLESLNIFVESSEQSSSEVSCRSSSTATSSSTTNDLSEENISIFLESSQIFSDNFLAKKILEKIPSQVEENPIGQATTSSTSSNSPEDFTFDNPSCKSEDSKSENYSSAELMKSSALDNESSDHEEDRVDNSLALVSVSLPESTPVVAASKEVKPVHENVAQVLDSLKYIRENIQRSMEMRCIVRVGPT